MSVAVIKPHAAISNIAMIDAYQEHEGTHENAIVEPVKAPSSVQP
jgi:hypothetical protein